MRILTTTALTIIYLTASSWAEEPSGEIHGKVVLLEGGQPAIGATVSIVDSEVVVQTDEVGAFRIAGLHPGVYKLRVDSGVEARESTVVVRAGAATELSLRIKGVGHSGEVIIVTGNRAPEKLMNTPASSHVLTGHEITTGLTHQSRLADIPAVQHIGNGISDQRISARGFYSNLGGRMLSMVDGRLSTLPGPGTSQRTMVPTSALDLKAVEVLTGPISAMYGPNAISGVVHILTKSPWDESGATVSLRGGQRNVADLALRLAGTVADRFGWKVNGQYFRGNDFEPDRDSPVHYYGTSIFEGDLVDDYDISTARAGGSLYYRFGEWTAQTEAEYSLSDGFWVTNTGRIQTRGMAVNTQSARIAGPRFFAHITRSAVDSGDKTYALDTAARAAEAMGGLPTDDDALEALRQGSVIVLAGDLIDSEVQYRHHLGPVRTASGLQLRRYNPTSRGTYLADVAGQDISSFEIGGYLQADTRLVDERLHLVAALRLDDHSNYSPQLSPSASIMYDVLPLHKLRLSASQAYRPPSTVQNYLYVDAISARGNIDGFEVRDMNGAVLLEIDPLQPETVRSLEFGYRGVIGDQLYIDGLVQQSWHQQFISPLLLLANPGDPEPSFAFDSDGQMIGDGSLRTYINYGEAISRSADLSLSYRYQDKITLRAGGSYLTLVDFSNESDTIPDLTLNAPTWKLTGGIKVANLGLANYFAEVRGNYRTAFAFESGSFTSSVLENGEIPARFLLDLTLGYTFPERGLQVLGTVTNLLNNPNPDLLGGPLNGRLAMLQLIYHHDGLRF